MSSRVHRRAVMLFAADVVSLRPGKKHVSEEGISDVLEALIYRLFCREFSRRAFSKLFGCAEHPYCLFSARIPGVTLLLLIPIIAFSPCRNRPTRTTRTRASESRLSPDSAFFVLLEANLGDIPCVKEQRVVVHERSDGRMPAFHVRLFGLRPSGPTWRSENRTSRFILTVYFRIGRSNHDDSQQRFDNAHP